ncbi:MAG TPA: Hpt domain-containing protein, partial [Planctomycetota bacterium]|nr:Hpt domain-containing protein [Planctomycetota bacterium]
GQETPPAFRARHPEAPGSRRRQVSDLPQEMELELLQEFVIECHGYLEQLERDLAILDRDPGAIHNMKNALRLFHSIRGCCGILSLERMGAVSQLSERVLVETVNAGLKPSPVALSAVRDAGGAVKTILDGIEARGAEPPGDDDAVLAKLRSVLATRPE